MAANHPLELLLAEQRRLAERLDRIEAKVDRVLAQRAPVQSALADDGFAADADDDFVDTWTAAQRFDLPIDTVRWLCRHKGMGRKKHGLWDVNVKALRRYLERRSRRRE